MGRNGKQDEYYKKCINIVPEIIRVKTNKETARIIAQMCTNIGVKHVVCSPGSRSAPLILAFEEQRTIKKRVIPDERVAGFSALGISLETNSPVALFCTSGTAALNLAPAICEAYYQKVPLIVITADRPDYARNTGENQTIQQIGIYKNFIENEIHINHDQKIEHKFISKLSNVFRSALSSKKPVHINISFEEPLYETNSFVDLKNFSFALEPKNITKNDLIKTSKEISSFNKIMWVAGLQNNNTKLLSNFKKLVQKLELVFFAEVSSNLRTKTESCLEEFFEIQTKNFNPNLHPELLITSEGQIISKRFRTYFKKYPPKKHIHISDSKQIWYSFNCSFVNLILPITQWGNLISSLKIKDSEYKNNVNFFENKILKYRNSFNQDLKWCDWTIYRKLSDFIGPNYVVHLGNSSVVRYAAYQKFALGTFFRSNRGTSGIDGCLSTAISAASVSKKKHVLLVGDISFMYDSNAFWQENIPPNLIIFLINNQGGNIFDLIQGPSSFPNFKKYFRTFLNPNFKKISEGFGLQYYFCQNFNRLNVLLSEIKKQNKLTIVEIKTNPELNEKIFKNYFKQLNLYYES